MEPSLYWLVVDTANGDYSLLDLAKPKVFRPPSDNQKLGVGIGIFYLVKGGGPVFGAFACGALQFLPQGAG